MAEPPAALAAIPGLPPEASARLLAVLNAEPAVREGMALWHQGHGPPPPLLRHRPHPGGAGSGPSGRLRLMGALDDLLLPWSIDVSLHHELPEPLRQHLARVGRRLVPS
ncbi:hypothetical protein NZK33_14345 [Cyanobium sp. FGCU-6]|nr:hypothetical protein [Cyanobium sp. FGCU6]